MPNTRVSQVSFVRGELSPSLYNRTDIEQYSIGLKTLKNGFVHQEGCVSNRAGLEYITGCKYNNKKARLLPFVFNSEQTYIIEAGDKYFRFIRNGGYIIYPDDYGVTEGIETVYDDTFSDFSEGEEITTFKIIDQTQEEEEQEEQEEQEEEEQEVTYIDLYCEKSDDYIGKSVYLDSELTQYYGDIAEFDNELGGTVKIEKEVTTIDQDKVALRGEIVEIETPYSEEDLKEIKISQSGDILTLTHLNYPPKNLIRYSHCDWILEDITFKASVETPVNVTATFSNGSSTTPPTTNQRTYSYCVTAVDEDNIESERSEVVECVAHREANWTVNETITITCDEVIGAKEYNVYRNVNGIYGYIGTSQATEEAVVVYNYLRYQNKADHVNQTTNAEYISIELMSEGDKKVYAKANSGKDHPLAVGDRFYEDKEFKTYYGTCTKLGSSATILGTYRYIKICKKGVSFVDDKIEPDLSSCAPIAKNPFEDNNNPSCSCYFMQRKFYANTYNKPQTLWASQTATSNNFNVSRPLIATDAIQLSLDDREVNEIRHLIPFKDLIVLTTNSEYKVNGADGKFEANPLPQATVQSTYGASHIQPVISGTMILFVEASGNVIRELGYDYLSDSYDGDELTLFASHLFQDKKIEYIAFSKAPYRILYVIFNDGTMATMTYNKKQKLCGWGRAETQGMFESVTVIHEGNEDVAYFIVKRTINNQTVRYIERNKTRIINDAKKAFLVDCGLYAHFDTPVTSVSGLQHLANTNVIVLADGGVIEGLKVSAQGTLTLPDEASDVVVGLPYEFELETLGVEGENTHGLKKQINTVTINVLNSREDFFVLGNQGSEMQLARSLASVNNTGYLYSGKKDATVLNTPTEFATVHLKQKYPLPLTISAISAIVNIEDITDVNQ